MEIGKILQEQKDKLKERKSIKSLLGSKKKIWLEVKKELEEIKRTFGDKRRSKIKTIESAEYNAEDFIEHDDVALVISRNGWLRKFKTLADPETLKFKENDGLQSITYANTRDLVAFFTSRGMVYVMKAFNLEYTRGGGFGEPVQSIFKFGDGERIIETARLIPPPEAESSKEIFKKADQKAFPFETAVPIEKEFMAISDAGYGFRLSLDNLGETSRSGKKVMTLKNSACLNNPGASRTGVTILTPAASNCCILATRSVNEKPM